MARRKRQGLGLGATTTTCSPLPGAQTRVCITRPVNRTKVHSAAEACSLLRRARNADLVPFDRASAGITSPTAAP